MAGPNTIEFTDSNFEAEVIKSAVPVLVDFWAEWCGPCRMLAPTIDQVAQELVGKAKVGKMDVDSNQSVAMKYGITAIPTVILFKGGEVQKKFIGLTKKDEFVKAVQAVA
jgi:thioredoxin 1